MNPVKHSLTDSDAISRIAKEIEFFPLYSELVGHLFHMKIVCTFCEYSGSKIAGYFDTCKM